MQATLRLFLIVALVLGGGYLALRAFGRREEETHAAPIYYLPSAPYVVPPEPRTVSAPVLSSAPTDFTPDESHAPLPGRTLAGETLADGSVHYEGAAAEQITDVVAQSGVDAFNFAFDCIFQGNCGAPT